eukprot:6230367-Pyramimonas_sp.AAC.1
MPQHFTEGQRDAWLRQPREVQQARRGEGLPTLYGDAILKEDRSATASPAGSSAWRVVGRRPSIYSSST